LLLALTAAALAFALPAQAHWPAHCSTRQSPKQEMACGKVDVASAKMTLGYWRHHDSPSRAASIQGHRWLLHYGRWHIRHALSRMRPVGRHVSVIATCYDLSGTTATGAPVGWGVVAVDPGFIPLHSRLYVPGYGPGKALDTGPAVQGAHIDLWRPSCSGCPNPRVVITVY
jgi:3D (Asp-Asp-Asp) domain-containing protein